MAGKLGDHGTLVIAATNRYMGRMSWQEVASSVGVDARSLFEVRKTDRWQAAVADVVVEMRKEAIPTAYACLVRCAEQDDVAAAKELLNRAEGAVNQLHELRGSGEDGAILHEHKGLGIAELFADPRARELACELEEAIASGHSDSADDTGGTGEGSDGG